MHDENPYAAPQAALDQHSEREFLTGELPFFADRSAFQQGAADAGKALVYTVSLVLLTILGSIFFGLLFRVGFEILLGVAVLLLAQRICWKFFSGLSQMAAASRLFLRPLLNWAKFAFLAGWFCYGLKLLIVAFFVPEGRAIYCCCDLVDSLAGAIVAITMGFAALRLGGELQQRGLRRAAWLTMIFMGGSHLLFLLMEGLLFWEVFFRSSHMDVDEIYSSIFFVVGIPALGFVIGFFALMGLLSQLSRLPIRNEQQSSPRAEIVLDAETIAPRRQMTEGSEQVQS